jgi:ABC-type branched-subunit amino acid transport system substrate-binding protein
MSRLWFLPIILILAVVIPLVACGPATPAATTTAPKPPTTAAPAPTTTAAPAPTTPAKPTPGGDVFIGVAYSTSGAIGALGQAMLKGVQLGAQTWNEKYGGLTIGNKIYQVKTVVYNNNMNPQEAVANTQRLITQDKPPVIIGDFVSGIALAQQPIIEDAKWPWVTNASNPNLTSDKLKYVVRVGAYDPLNVPGWWQSNAALMGDKKNVAFLVSKTDFNVARAGLGKTEALKNGFKIVYEDTFAADATDFYALIDKAKAASPDLVYVSGYANSGTFIKQAKEKGLKAQFLIEDTFLPDLGKVLGADGIGVWVHAAINPQGTNEIEKLYAKYAPPPAGSTMAYDFNYGLGWEGMMRALTALEAAQTISTDEASRVKIAQALRTAPFNGILTIGKTDENGNCYEYPRILQIVGADGSAKVVAEGGKVLK